MTCWHTLGITPTGDEAAIKKAYAARLREHRPDRDPAGFRRVRAAYEEALRQRPYIRPRHAKKRKHHNADAAVPEPPVAVPEPDNSGYYGYTATFPVFPASLGQPAPHGYLDRPGTSQRDTAPYDYLDRPGTSQRDPAPHGYLDRPAENSESPAALLARLQAAWKTAASDEALRTILQAQAADVAAQNIDFRLDYTAALQPLLAADRPHSRLWAQTHYGLREPDSRRHLADLIRTGYDPVARDALLARHYPAIAAWRQLGRLRRRSALYTHWTRSDPAAILHDWQSLRDELPGLPVAALSAAWPPLATLAPPSTGWQALFDILTGVALLLLGLFFLGLFGVLLLTLDRGGALSGIILVGLALFRLCNYLRNKP